MKKSEHRVNQLSEISRLIMVLDFPIFGCLKSPISSYELKHRVD